MSGGGLIGGVVGAALLAPFGLSNIGFMVGSLLGGYSSQPAKQGPRLSDLTPQTSEYGRPIPIVYGTVGIQGNVIWATKLVEHASTTDSGKGGGGPSATTYTYSGSFAVAFSEGIKNIGRIWAGPDKTILWDGKQFFGSGTIRIYTGSETQLPDPAIEADKGAGMVPAYRGTCYVVLENLDLSPYGNAYPFLTAEVGDFAPGAIIDPASSVTTGGGTATTPMTYHPLRDAYGTPVGVDHYPAVLVGTKLWQANMQNASYDGTGFANWTTTPAGSISIIDPATMVVQSVTHGEPGPRTWGGLVYSAATNTVFAYDWWSLYGFSSHVASFNATTGAFIAEYVLADKHMVVILTGADVVQSPRVLSMDVDPINGSLWVCSEAGDVFHFADNTLTSPGIHSISGNTWYEDTLQSARGLDVAVTNAHNAYVVDGWFVHKITPALTETLVAAWVTQANVTAVEYNAAANLLYFHERLTSDTGGVYATSNWVQIVNAATDVMGAKSPTDYGQFVDFKYDAVNNIIWELVGVTVRARYADTAVIYNAAYVSGSPRSLTVNIPTTLTGGQAGSYVILTNSDIRAVTFPDPAGGGGTGYVPATVNTTLELVIRDLSLRVGFTLDQLDTSALIDEVSGYVIASQTPVRQAIDALRPVYYFDGIESEGKVKFVKRGGAVVAVIPETALGAHDGGSSRSDPLDVARQMEVELPKVMTVGYMLAAKQYDHATKVARRMFGSSQTEQAIELSMTLLDAKAMEVAQTNLYEIWSGRLTFKFQLPDSYRELEPTDPIQIRDFVMRLTKVTDQGKYFSCEAKSEDRQAYSQLVTVTETPAAYVAPQVFTLSVLEVL